MNMEIKELPAVRVAYIRHMGPYGSKGIMIAWKRLLLWACARGLSVPDLLRIGVCYGNPAVTPPDQLRYDACLEVGPEVNGEGEIGIASTVPGLYAMMALQGAYDEMDQIYASVCGEWIPAHGFKLRTAPVLKYYYSLPGLVLPAELRSEVFFPIERA